MGSQRIQSEMRTHSPICTYNIPFTKNQLAVSNSLTIPKWIIDLFIGVEIDP